MIEFDIHDAAALLGYVTLLVGFVVFGSSALAFVQSIPSRLAARPHNACEYDTDDPPTCLSHGCGAFEQCGKLKCPHCAYKYDPHHGIAGYPVGWPDKANDPHNPNNYRSIRHRVPRTVTIIKPEDVEFIEYDRKGIKEIVVSGEHITRDDTLTDWLPEDEDDDGCP